MKEKKNKMQHAMTGSAEGIDSSSELIDDKPEHRSKPVLQEYKVDEQEEVPEEKEPTIEDRFDSLSNVDARQVADIMEQILSLSQVEKDLEALAAQPGYILDSKEKSVWLYSTTRRSFCEVKTGSEILSIEKIDGSKSRCLINNDIFEVDDDMINCVGWN